MEIAQARVAQLEDENAHSRGTKPRALPSPNTEPFAPVEGEVNKPTKPAPKYECASWLRPVPPAGKRVDGGPPVAKGGAETEAQRQRVNADATQNLEEAREDERRENQRRIASEVRKLLKELRLARRARLRSRSRS